MGKGGGVVTGLPEGGMTTMLLCGRRNSHSNWFNFQLHYYPVRILMRFVWPGGAEICVWGGLQFPD